MTIRRCLHPNRSGYAHPTERKTPLDVSAARGKALPATLLLLCVGLLGTGSATTTASQLERLDPGITVPSISVDELERALEDKETAPRVIDVRLREDFEADPVLIAGASWRDPNAIDAWVEELSRETPVVVYCVRGHWVSQAATKKLRDMGRNVLQLSGGLEAWKTGGGPTIPGKKP
jgi:rhodanese-related sulfurtransferase